MSATLLYAALFLVALTIFGVLTGQAAGEVNGLGLAAVATAVCAVVAAIKEGGGP